MAVASLLLNAQASAHDAVLVVANQTLHIETFGSNGPTVVLEAGQGNDFTTRESIAGSIAAFARVVVYDRTGLGQSLPMIDRTSPVTADKVTTALHALLADATIRPPYILVGHSLGGLYVQSFAIRYPAEVSGVVLIDSSSPDAPGELTTRARLEPGTAAYLEEEGVAESNRQVLSAGPLPARPPDRDRGDRPRTVLQGMGIDADAAATAARRSFPSICTHHCRGQRTRRSCRPARARDRCGEAHGEGIGGQAVIGTHSLEGMPRALRTGQFTGRSLLPPASRILAQVVPAKGYGEQHSRRNAPSPPASSRGS
jgi:pimeloyl-ACP methyl ester carboxylesterase